LSSPDVLAAILQPAHSGPGRPAVKDSERDLTYGDLVLEVDRVAAGLQARGVAVGDRVALHFPNSVDFVVVALACLRVGAIFVPLAITDPPARLEVIIGDCGPAVIVTSDARGEGVEPAPDHLAPVVAISELLAEGADLTGLPELAELPPAAERIAYAIYTSGTTGTPKGVLIGNRAFAAAVAATADALGLSADTRTLCVSPFHFDGSFGTLFPTLYRGGAIVIRPREALLFPRTFFNAVAREAITYTGFSPSYLRLLLSSPQMDRLAGTTLQVVALGGEASSAADVRSLWAAAPTVRVFNRYGPTETTIAVTHLELTPALIADGKVPIGRPHPDVTFHLVDESGQQVADADHVGELYIGGDQLMAGYWGAPELTAEVLRTDVVPGETVYRTGDLMYRTPPGDYVYVDRADRVIKRLGIRISLVELGEAMRSLAGVSAAACTCFDNDGQPGIVAFVVADGSTTSLELRQAAADRLPDSMLPDRVELVDTLPLTKSSKLDERRLLAEAGLVALAATTVSG
jgi:D-alanine--poly(phosphoribitol) ligase subunit 1